MVAYSFNKRFAPPIIAGIKLHTIRADRKRHARPGEELQLYVGMRTKHCRLLARRPCVDVLPIEIILGPCREPPYEDTVILPDRIIQAPADLDAFGISDGFDGWSDMKSFWRQNHAGVDYFKGVMIRWEAPANG